MRTLTRIHNEKSGYADRMLKDEVLSSTTVASPLGALSLVASKQGLMLVEFSRRAPKLLHGRHVMHSDDNPVLDIAAAQLDEYFQGTRQRFNIPLDLVGTPFQVEVWKALSKVRFGSTMSYAQEAAMIGRPTAVRAVGGANGRNPVPIVLPCHRVIAADGGLGGFSAGLPKKVWLQNHERTVADAGKQRSPSRVG